jgi:transcriptional regulator with XRE-family HTH domain
MRGEVAAWESGQRRPSIAKAKPIVDRYGITLDWLYLGSPSGLSYELGVKLGDVTNQQS